MKIGNDISVFNLTKEQVTELTKERLYPQNNDRGRWGCASLTGFLAPGERLMDVAQSHKKILNDRSINYHTIGKRLHEITNAAVKALGKPSETPILVENGKFEVTVRGPSICAQFCPFSPEDDSEAGPFTRFDRVCPSATTDYTIRNTTTNKSIKFGALLPHLIGIHHFFPGNVQYRLDPKEVIETLELTPEAKPSPQPETPVLTDKKEVHSWQFVGKYNLPKRKLAEIAETNGSKLEEIEDGLFRIELPYFHGYHNNPQSIEFENPNNYVWTHLFNTHPDKEISINKIINGTLLKTTLPPRSNCVFLADKVVPPEENKED